MRIVFIPPELDLPDLLAIETLPEDVQGLLQELRAADKALGTEMMLARIEKLLLQVSAEKPETSGTVHLFYATALWHAGRWLDALDTLQQVHVNLHFAITQEARYHEALALYLEGLIAYTLHADARAGRHFRAAQSGLLEAARYWGQGIHQRRMQACHDLDRWISDLLSVMQTSTRPELHYILPLFEEVDGIFQRMGVFWFPSPYLTLPQGTFLRVYEAGEFDVIPLEAWRVPLLAPVPGAYYCVQRLLADGDRVPTSRKGDLLLLERSEVLPEGEHGIFIRRYHDGRILFRTQSEGRGFTGVAKALLREREGI